MTGLFANLAEVVAPVFAVAFVGYVWRRAGKPFDQEFVTNMVTLVGAPCLVFVTLVKVRLSPAEMAQMGGATALCLGLFAVVGAVILRACRLSQRVYLPSLVFPNIGNVGLPVCLFAFGQHGLGLAMIYFTVCTVLQFCFGPAIAAGKLRLDLLVKTPFLYAAIVALGVGGAGLTPPDWLMKTLTLVGDVTIPLMLLALGAALANFAVGRLTRQVLLAAARIALGAAGGWAVAALLGLDGTARGVLVIQSAMPVAVFNYLFARLYGDQPDEVAGLVLLSTALSFVTLPLLVGAVTPG